MESDFEKSLRGPTQGRCDKGVVRLGTSGVPLTCVADDGRDTALWVRKNDGRIDPEKI